MTSVRCDEGIKKSRTHALQIRPKKYYENSSGCFLYLMISQSVSLDSKNRAQTDLLSLIIEAAKGRCSVADLRDLTEIPSDRLNKCIRLLVENELVQPLDFVDQIVTTERGISFLNLCDEINGLVVTDRMGSSRVQYL
jgi:predicted transcriptional regulator